jgi:hypothetical protein
MSLESIIMQSIYDDSDALAQLTKRLLEQPITHHEASILKAIFKPVLTIFSDNQARTNIRIFIHALLLMQNAKTGRYASLANTPCRSRLG